MHVLVRAKKLIAQALVSSLCASGPENSTTAKSKILAVAAQVLLLTYSSGTFCLRKSLHVNFTKSFSHLPRTALMAVASRSQPAAPDVGPTKSTPPAAYV